MRTPSLNLPNGADQGDIPVDHGIGGGIKLMGRYSIDDFTNTPSPTFAVPNIHRTMPR